MRKSILLVLCCFIVMPLFARPPLKKKSDTSAVQNDSARLAAILSDTQSKSSIDANSWKVIANEANALANRIYARTSGDARKTARELRTHVREMRAAALKGDVDGAKSHAALALPFAYQLMDAS